MTCFALLIFIPITKTIDKTKSTPMKILKWSFIGILTVAFAYLWLKSFYQFAKNPTREPKYIDAETQQKPATAPSANPAS